VIAIPAAAPRENPVTPTRRTPPQQTKHPVCWPPPTAAAWSIRSTPFACAWIHASNPVCCWTAARFRPSASASPSRIRPARPRSTPISGVDFGAAGRHTLEIQGIGPFGNARFKQAHTVVRTGQIAAIRLLSAKGNVADGKTPVTLSLQLLDDHGQPIDAPAELEIRDGNLKPCQAGGDALTREKPEAKKTVHVDADGRVSFAPVTTSGRYRVSLGYNDATVDADVYVKPFLRDWIIVGLAEGSAGYHTVSGNMESLDDADIKDNFYKDGRMAFFAKGKVRGRWLLTLAYDSEKDKDDPDNTLFQTIDPEAYYTLYGDATTQQYDAASIRKLYIKLEREQFYLLFGDYDTGLTVTELSKYSRTLNGLKAEFAGQAVSFSGFATDTRQAFVRDEIRGDGTSGLYRLTRRNILINSEKITLETRDRFKSEVILSSQSLSRYVDYTIDYDAGTLFSNRRWPAGMTASIPSISSWNMNPTTGRISPLPTAGGDRCGCWTNGWKRAAPTSTRDR
jgi:hypothetical protein